MQQAVVRGSGRAVLRTRSVRRALDLALVAALGVASGVTGAIVGKPSPVGAGPASIVLDGHGYGHGVGLSQYGALGYAIDFGWSSAQILDHYYGRTTAGTAANSDITVRLSGLDGSIQTAVVHDRAALVIEGVAGGPWRSLVAREISDGHYGVWGRSDANICPAPSVNLDDPASGWTRVVADSTAVVFRPATDTSASADVADLVGLCEPATGRVRYYRGSIRAVNAANGANRTVSQLPIEQYIRSVVGGEVSWGWAAMGGGKGAQALQAQAVAARSYGLAENKEPYAKTCDNNCQTYRGAAYRAGVAGTLVAQEFGPTDAAVAATAGVVRRTAAGAIAYTMYSSSSGGHTAVTSLGFPAVVDEGDAVAGNAGHSWSVTISAATLEAAYPTIGSFSGLTITNREGNGEWGGRVLAMTVDGTSGSFTTTGNAFRSKLGLKSNWFVVRGADGTPPPTTPGPPPGTATCAGREAPAVAGVTANSAASLFVPIVPTRLIDTRIGLGTEQRPLGRGCTLEVDPRLPDDATSVVVNVTAVEPVNDGYLTAYPCGADRPLASIVPAISGSIVPGTAVVPLNADGVFCLFAMDTTEIVIDLSGMYRTGGGDRFESIVAQRRFDSRAGAVLANETVVRIPIAGIGGIPASATAIAATVHSTDATLDSFLTIWPCDAPRPTTSVLNTSPRAAVTNHIQVGLDPAGAVCVYVQHAMHLVLDVSGWFGPTASSSYHAQMPTRILDTRDGTGLSGAFAAGQNRALVVVGAGGLPPTDVSAVAAEVTSTDAAQAAYITVHPCLPATPDVSMVRNQPARVAATTVVGIVDASGRWCLQTSAAMHVVVDVSGYYD